MTREPVAQLLPRRPAGRSDRKAGAYADQISTLRAGGFTYEAIREALSDVGIELTESSLRREVRRLSKRHQVGPVETQPPIREPLQAAPIRSVTQHFSTVPSPSGRQLAKTFFTAHPHNPLIPAQEAP